MQQEGPACQEKPARANTLANRQPFYLLARPGKLAHRGAPVPERIMLLQRLAAPIEAGGDAGCEHSLLISLI